jgi:hypothetical protein
MGTTTARLALPYPYESDPDNVPLSLQNLCGRLDTILGIDGYGTLADRPSPGNEGFTYFASDQTGAGGTEGLLFYDNGSGWIAINPYVAFAGTGGQWGVAATVAHSDHTHSVVVRTTHTYAISGPVSVYANAQAGAPEPFYPGLANGQTANIAAVRYSVASGTSVTFTVTSGGSPVAGGSALTAGPAPVLTTLGQAITDGENLGITVTAVSTDNPSGLTVSFYLDLTCPVQAS